MSRYGERTEANPVALWGKGGGALSEITFIAAPAPAVTSTPMMLGPSTNAQEHIILTVNATCSIQFSTPATAIADVIVLGGGGAGGSSSPEGCGGGGAGGVVQSSTTITPGPHPITVGAGGAQTPLRGSTGNNSSAFGLNANGGGGGGGGSGTEPGLPGGSGGGGARFVNPVVGAVTIASVPSPGILPASPLVQGTPGGGLGGNGGGGGESGRGGSGGTGRLLGNRYGSIGAVAGGGGSGGGAGSTSPALGGLGGGGNGATRDTAILATAGTANTGGGGGGGAATNPPVPNPSTTLGQNGGSGAVLIRYKRFQG